MKQLKREAENEILGMLLNEKIIDSKNLLEIVNSIIDRAYLDGKEYGLNAKQDYADKAYQQAKEEVIEDIEKSLVKMRQCLNEDRIINHRAW